MLSYVRIKNVLFFTQSSILQSFYWILRLKNLGICKPAKEIE